MNTIAARFLLGLICGSLLLTAGCDRGVAAAIQKQKDLRAKAAAKNAPETGTEGAITRTSGDILITLYQFQVTEKGLFVVAKEGSAFVVLDVSFENKGAEEITVASRHMRLVDAAGTAFPKSMVGASKPGPDSTIPPGKSTRGQIAYEVPVGTQGLKWYVKGGDGAEEVVFNQPSQP